MKGYITGNDGKKYKYDDASGTWLADDGSKAPNQTVRDSKGNITTQTDSEGKDTTSKGKKGERTGPLKNVTAAKVAKVGAQVFGQMAADRKASMAGYSGGTTDVVDASKNMTAARGPSDVLTASERKRLEKLTGGYGSSTIA